MHADCYSIMVMHIHVGAFKRRWAETQPKLHFLIIEHESNVLGEFGCPDMFAREMRPEFTSIQPPIHV